MSRNAALFALMCLVWGLTWLPIKVGAQHVPPVFLAASRFVIAGTLMLAWAGRDVLKVPAAAWPRVVMTALGLADGDEALASRTVEAVRDELGALAALKKVYVVPQLPKTRSGKILRNLLRKIVNSEPFEIPPTIEDTSVPAAIATLVEAKSAK